MLTYRLQKPDSCSQTPPTLDFLPDSTNSQKAGNQASPSRQRIGKKISRNQTHKCISHPSTQMQVTHTEASHPSEQRGQRVGSSSLRGVGGGGQREGNITHTHTGTYATSDFSKVTLRALPSNVRGNDFQPRITYQLNPLGAHTKSTLRPAESQSK